MIPGIIRNLLRPQHDPLAIARHVGIHFVEHLGAERERRRRRRGQLARLQQPNHSILNHFRVRSQPLERPFLQPEQHRVRDIAHARLQRQQIRRHPALLHFPAQELQNVPGDPLRSLVRRLERAVAVRRVVSTIADNLLCRRCSDTATRSSARLHQRNRPAIRRRLQPVINVVHPLQRRRLPRIHFENDPLRAIDPGLVIADATNSARPAHLPGSPSPRSAPHPSCPEIHTPQTAPHGSDGCPCSPSRPH